MHFLFGVFCCITLAETYKILVFSPVISRSHMISNGRIADELAMAGHDVVLFEPDFLNLSHTVNPVSSSMGGSRFFFSFKRCFARHPEVLRLRLQTRDVLNLVRTLTYRLVELALLYQKVPCILISTEKSVTYCALSGNAFAEVSQYRAQQGLLQYQHAYNMLCEDLINRESVMEKLRMEKFDGYFGEQINLCGNGIAYALAIKSHFWVSSCPISDHMAWILGMPQPSSYIPSLIGSHSNHKMSYFERVQNIYYTSLYVYFSKIADEETDKVFRKKYGKNFPSLTEIASNSDMIFVATDEFVEIPRPTLPNVVHIGGIGLNENLVNDSLQEPFAEQMRKGSKGVVYFSLGTLINTTSLPIIAKTTIMDAIRQTPDHHFIMVADKFDKFTRTLAETIPNVYVSSWAPQPAILKHPRLKAFITHGGYNSIIEASRAAVPLITIPFFFDQIRNSRAVEGNGWGIPLNKRVLIEEPQKLLKTLHDLLNNEKYKKAAVRISTLIRTKPFSASDRLVKHTEFVLANGGMKELLVEGRRLPFTVYHNLDIFVPFGIAFLLISYMILRLLATIFARVVTVEKIKVQ